MKNRKETKTNLAKKVEIFYDKIASSRKKWIKKSKSFHKEDMLMLSEFTFKNSRVLELGCGSGQLLNSLQPSFGIGIDISREIIKEAKKNYKTLSFIRGDISEIKSLIKKDIKFDYIILSDTIGYLNDIQKTLEQLHRYCHKDTRLILSYYSPLWSPIFTLATFFKLKMPDINTHLLNLTDIKNFLSISDFEVVRTEKKILSPVKLLGVGRVINKFLAPLPIFSFFCLRHYIISRSIPESKKRLPASTSVIIPCKNEMGNVEEAVKRLPKIGNKMEVIFIEGNSSDGTWKKIKEIQEVYNKRQKSFKIRSYKQNKKGKAEAVFFGFQKAKNEVLFILDGDLTVSPEELDKFWKKISSGDAEYVNGSRLVYPMDDKAMQFLNFIANKLFSILFSWLLGQKYTDTLCGTKVLTKQNYLRIKNKNKDLGDFDPFGDFFIIFGCSRLSLKMCEIPIRYKARVYGSTQISRFSHGFMLIKMVIFAFFRIKAI